MWNVLGLAVGGAIDWFRGDQELKKVKAEGKIEVQKAKNQAEVARISKQADQDHDQNMEMVRQMERSWKDEFVLILVTIPFAMCFIPELQEYAVNGFTVASTMPMWYQILLVGIFFNIYGMKDIFRLVIQLIVGKIRKPA